MLKHQVLNKHTEITHPEGKLTGMNHVVHILIRASATWLRVPKRAVSHLLHATLSHLGWPLEIQMATKFEQAGCVQTVGHVTVHCIAIPLWHVKYMPEFHTA